MSHKWTWETLKACRTDLLQAYPGVNDPGVDEE